MLADHDQRGPLPLYQKVKLFILGGIESGELPPGSRIPSENDLVERLGASRMTVNRALRELSMEGILQRVQGVGTFVAAPKARTSLFGVRSIAEEIREGGGKHSCDVMLLNQEQADAQLAAALDLTEGARVFHSVVLHRDRGKPVQLAERYVNPAAAPGYLDQDFHTITPSEYLFLVAPLSEVEHIIEAKMPEKRVARLLEMAPGEACLVLRRRTWSMGRVVMSATMHYPGSRHTMGERFKPREAGQSVS